MRDEDEIAKRSGFQKEETARDIERETETEKETETRRDETRRERFGEDAETTRANAPPGGIPKPGPRVSGRGARASNRNPRARRGGCETTPGARERRVAKHSFRRTVAREPSTGRARMATTRFVDIPFARKI